MSKRKFLSMVVILFSVLFLFLSIAVSADDCKGEITNLAWKIDEHDKLSVNVNFENTGQETCNYRVYLINEKGEDVTHAPNPRVGNHHVKLSSRESGEATIIYKDAKSLGKKFKVELRHVGFPFGEWLMDSSEEIKIAFECSEMCHGERIEEFSHISEEDCWDLLGQNCGMKTDFQNVKKFEECKEKCEDYCSIKNLGPSIDEEFKTDFFDGCMRECGRTCDTYYEILTIENPGITNPRVIDPCGYSKTVVTYDIDCEKISGDFDDYRVEDLPQCPTTQQAIFEDYELFFPEMRFLGKEITPEEKEEAGKCKILNAYWEKTDAIKGEKVHMFIETSKECEGRAISFKYNILKYVFLGTRLMETLYGGDMEEWSPAEKGTYFFNAFIVFENGRESHRKKSNDLIVSDCVDDALLLCQGKQGNKVVYGVTDSTKYVEIARKNLTGNRTKHWLMEKRYFPLDLKECKDDEKGWDYREITYLDDPKYVEFIKDKFGDESYFNKYSEMYGESYAAHLYCYKIPELKDKKGCRNEINHNWYSMQDKFNLSQFDFIYLGYIEEAKKWNFYQDVDDAPAKEALKDNNQKKSELLKNSWTKIFEITPRLEDLRNKKNWTLVGNGTVYIGAGIERYDACKFSCDAQGENDALEGCNFFREGGAKKWGGMGTNECSLSAVEGGCLTQSPEKNSEDCAKSGSGCGDLVNDCGKLCRIDAYYTDEGIIAKTTIKFKSSDALEEKIVEISKPDQGIEVKKDSDNPGNVKILIHPAFNITERGNLKFKVEDAKFESLNENTYVIERTYKPENDKEKFIVDSDIVFNYELLDLEKVNDLTIEVEHEYSTNLERKIYNVDCNDECEEAHYLVTGCDFSYIDKFPTNTVTVNDNKYIPKVHHSNITNTSDVSITGIIDKYVNEFNEIEIYGFLNVTLDPDILGAFLLEAKDAGISYRELFYPIKHFLFKKKSSPPKKGEGIKEYSYLDRYGYENVEGFNFKEQCIKICPEPKCECPIENPLEPTCINDLTGEKEKRKDCACAPSGCYPDPCVSNRTFHEEESSRILNGNFERELKFWKKEGAVERELGGYSGYRLKLEDGKVFQDIVPATHSQPYGALCLEYGIESAKEFKVVLIDGDKEKEHPICSGDCSKKIGWRKACFHVVGNLSKVEIISKGGVAYVDNVNLGNFYDFVHFQTLNISQIEYMDETSKGYNYVGLFKTSGIKHKENSYLFDLEVAKIHFPHPTEVGKYSIYTLSDEDILNTTMTLYTFFKNETYPLFPARREENLYINVTFRNASVLTLERFPKGFKISRGTKVTVKANLSFFGTHEPIGNAKIYLDFIGEDKEAVKEICQESHQYNNNLKCEEKDDMLEVYIKTQDKGIATFSFKPKHTMDIDAIFLGNQRASPTMASITIPVLVLKSPLLSLEFIILIAIFYIAIFSYRFFKPRRLDLRHWFEELIGKKL